MDFRISDTFTDSLARLTGDEQKAVKTTAFDLQVNPAHPSMSLHKIEQSKDKNFWSVRVSSDIRLIVHKTASSFLLCYVDHHDRAYKWAERRKLETHPTTGAAQFVEIRERVQEVVAPATLIAAEPIPKLWAKSAKTSLFAGLSDAQLLAYGVPPEWLADVRLADEDSVLTVAEHLPAEAAEALLEIATGGAPQIAPPPPPSGNPFDHPDAMRRFRVMADAEALAQAIEYPWEKWTTFLHPAQRQYVDRDFSGPAKVAGSAGTGKTIVALHRAVSLARRDEDARVLLTTFSSTLAAALGTKLQLLIGNQPRLGERIEVDSLRDVGERLYRARLGPAKIAQRDDVVRHLKAAIEAVRAGEPSTPFRFALGFVTAEWLELVDAWQLTDWEAYRDFKRLGRKTRLSEPQRAHLWRVFEAANKSMRAERLLTEAGMFTALAGTLSKANDTIYQHVVVDEAQDLTASQLRFLVGLGSTKGKVRANGLFFAGDLGQRIFQQSFSWKAVGADVRGRSKTLHVNYRTSHQIRAAADRLLGPEVSDVDGNVESRNGTISVFNGPAPEVRAFPSFAAEGAAVAAWLLERIAEGYQAHELAVFVRSGEQVLRAVDAIQQAGLEYRVLDQTVETTYGQLSLCQMHLAKGLEFRAVAVIACDDEVVPLQDRIDAIADEADLEEVYNTERHLLYVACTRARDRLLVSSTAPASEFFEDLMSMTGASS
jgi:superfamily I DNA/RNA helicase